MPHVFYSANLAATHEKIWQDAASSKPRFKESMGTREKKFYFVDGEEVEGNLTSETAELPERLAARYPDAEYRGEGALTRVAKMV